MKVVLQTRNRFLFIGATLIVQNTNRLGKSARQRPELPIFPQNHFDVMGRILCRRGVLFARRDSQGRGGDQPADGAGSEIAIKAEILAQGSNIDVQIAVMAGTVEFNLPD